MSKSFPNKDLYQKLFAALKAENATHYVELIEDGYNIKMVCQWELDYLTVLVHFQYSYNVHGNGGDSFYPMFAKVLAADSEIILLQPQEYVTERLTNEARVVFNSLKKPLTKEQKIEDAINAFLSSEKVTA